MIVYRLTKSKYNEDLTGKGAAKTGGRWNSKGNYVIYASDSRALCTAEIAVHTGLGNVPDSYELVTIEFPDTVAAKKISLKELPADWKSFPHSGSTQRIGDNFILENKFLVLKVPSVVVQGDFNYLINPNHKDFKKVKIKNAEPFEFDERLFVR